jgi:hypothetical protein
MTDRLFGCHKNRSPNASQPQRLADVREAAQDAQVGLLHADAVEDNPPAQLFLLDLFGSGLPTLSVGWPRSRISTAE